LISEAAAGKQAVTDSLQPGPIRAAVKRDAEVAVDGGWIVPWQTETGAAMTDNRKGGTSDH
jgi:hypothetical protein